MDDIGAVLDAVGSPRASLYGLSTSAISSLAAPGDVLVSRTVKDLVAGSGFAFEDRGERALKGVLGEWRLYAVVDG